MLDSSQVHAAARRASVASARRAAGPGARRRTVCAAATGRSCGRQTSPARSDLPEVARATARAVLSPAMRSRPQLPAIAQRGVRFSRAAGRARPRRGGCAVLELFHGPTAAFKDFGARFLAAALARLQHGTSAPLTILVATSGDTGGAVAAAFHGRRGHRGRGALPQGPGVADAGAAAHLLGRQRARAARCAARSMTASAW